MKTFSILLLALTVSACSSIPFKVPESTPLSKDNETILADHRGHLPAQNNQLNSAVFSFFGKKAMSLGVLKSDQLQQQMTFVMMTQMGIKLVAIEYKNGKLTSSYVIDQIAKQDKHMATYIAEDLKTVYLELIPRHIIEMNRETNKLEVESQAGDARTIHYTFSGDKGYLTEKRIVEDGETVRTAHYYEYKEIKGKRYPTGIVLKNHKFHYTIIIRLKKVR